jgi:hypothetical protein
MRFLREISETERRRVGRRGRRRVLAAHTAAHRAIEFEAYLAEAGLSRPDPLPLSEAMSA